MVTWEKQDSGKNAEREQGSRECPQHRGGGHVDGPDPPSDLEVLSDQIDLGIVSWTDGVSPTRSPTDTYSS